MESALFFAFYDRNVLDFESILKGNFKKDLSQLLLLSDNNFNEFCTDMKDITEVYLNELHGGQNIKSKAKKNISSLMQSLENNINCIILFALLICSIPIILTDKSYIKTLHEYVFCCNFNLFHTMGNFFTISIPKEGTHKRAYRSKPLGVRDDKILSCTNEKVLDEMQKLKEAEDIGIMGLSCQYRIDSGISTQDNGVKIQLVAEDRVFVGISRIKSRLHALAEKIIKENNIMIAKTKSADREGVAVNASGVIPKEDRWQYIG